MILNLDSVIPGKGLGDDPYGFDIRIQAISGRYTSPNSKTITIIDSPILQVTGDSSDPPRDKGKAKIQWGRESGVIDGRYTFSIRKSETDEHHDTTWMPTGWQDNLEANSLDPDPSGPVNGLLEFNTSELELGKLYGVQLSYKTNTSHVFSAVHDYVWPSTGFPGDDNRPERVATFPYFGHHTDGDYAYRICTDTLPNTTTGERDAWVSLIETALEQWEVATNGLVTATPEYANAATKEYEPCTAFDWWRLFFLTQLADDNRSEIKVFDIGAAEAIFASIEIASDPFKRCVIGATACVTSRTGYERTDRIASNELAGVDISFNLRKLKDYDPHFIPDRPEEIHFNKCGESAYTQRPSDRSNDYYLYQTAVHEAGHAFGLSNVTDLWKYLGNSIPWPGWFDPFSRATYVASHPTINNSVMNYVIEQDCSPHDFDVLAISALYQGVR